MPFSFFLTLMVSSACLARVASAVNPEGSQVYETASGMSFLEKNMEFLIQQVQDMKFQLESTKTQLESRIKENQASTLQQVQDMKTQLESRIEENIDLKFASLEINQQNIVDEVASIQLKMSTRVAAAVDEKFDDFSSRSDVLDMVRNSLIAFAARATSSFSRVAGETIIFPEVTLNSGNAYDLGTGIFTCPLEGIYFFAASILSYTDFSPDNNPGVQIVRDDEALVGLYVIPDDAEFIMMSNSVMMSCAAQQQVSVRAGTDITIYHQLSSTTFNGFYLGEETNWTKNQ